MYVEDECTWFYMHVPSMSAVPYRLRTAYLNGMLRDGRRPPEWPELRKYSPSLISGEHPPFTVIHKDGVGELVQLAAERGRSAREDLKLGICGEHGGDPASIAFCEKTGLDYISCSPYRVPIARLAAAQSYLKIRK